MIEGLHTKAEGSVGEARVTADLIARGYAVFHEFGDLSRTDPIAEGPGGELIRIQVECRSSEKGSVTLDRRRSGPRYRFRYQPDDVDVFALYVYDFDEILYVSSALVCSGEPWPAVPPGAGAERPGTGHTKRIGLRGLPGGCGR